MRRSTSPKGTSRPVSPSRTTSRDAAGRGRDDRQAVRPRFEEDDAEGIGAEGMENRFERGEEVLSFVHRRRAEQREPRGGAPAGKSARNVSKSGEVGPAMTRWTGSRSGRAALSAATARTEVGRTLVRSRVPRCPITVRSVGMPRRARSACRVAAGHLGRVRRPCRGSGSAIRGCPTRRRRPLQDVFARQRCLTLSGVGFDEGVCSVCGRGRRAWRDGGTG